MRRKSALSFLAIAVISLLLFCSCDEDVTRVESEEEEEEGEISVTIITPQDGELLDEATVVLVDVVSDYDIEKVDLIIDRILVFRATESPYKFLWFVGFWADERRHTLQAKAVDVNGKMVLSEIVEVEVEPSALAKPIACCPIWIICCPVSLYNLTLKWYGVEGAEGYRVTVYYPELGWADDLIYYCNMAYCSSRSIIISCGDNYYGELKWKVCAHNSGRYICSDWHLLQITSDCPQ